jgi:hypothetical protein
MTTADELRHLVLSTARSGPGRGLDPSLRSRLLSYVASRRAAGASWASLGAELGLAGRTLARWSTATPSDAVVPFRPVHVQPPAPTLSPFVLRGPHGVVVEGLSLDDLSDLLRRLS